MRGKKLLTLTKQSAKAMIMSEALENVKAAIASSDVEHKTDAKKKAVPRKAAGQAWEDPILAEWPEGIMM